jgi:hypothetical protein
MNNIRTLVAVWVALAVNVTAWGQIGTLSAQEVENLLDAIRTVETGAEADPDAAVGDGGKALGAFQIWRVYWIDAVERNPALKQQGYNAVTNRAYARAVVKAYWKRYAPKNATAEDLARIHNGGPKGHKKDSTLKYWVKVRKVLN